MTSSYIGEIIANWTKSSYVLLPVILYFPDRYHKGSIPLFTGKPIKLQNSLQNSEQMKIALYDHKTLLEIISKCSKAVGC